MLKKFGNHLGARRNMVAELRALAQKHSAERIVFAYEASALGFTLYDELTQTGLECHVLAPSKLPESAHRRKRKSDPQDALRVLQVIKAHELAGNDLPAVWIPSVQLRTCAKNPKKKNIGVVALMRRLGIRLWHRACDALALAA